MNRFRLFAWGVVAGTVGLFVWLARHGDGSPPSTGEYIFWISLLLAVELLPVSLAFGTEVTMGFPVHLALALLFPPWAAMLIAGVSAFDLREVRQGDPAAPGALQPGSADALGGVRGDHLLRLRKGRHPVPLRADELVIVAGALAHVIVNLTLVSTSVALDDGIPVRQGIPWSSPRSLGGFIVSYMLLTGLGVATAAVYETPFGMFFVAVFLVPLIFARLSIIGARAQQELSEKVRKQQQALLTATEKVFEERENERKRIAEDIHDSPLQMLAAASYGCGNAREFLDSGYSSEAVDSDLICPRCDRGRDEGATQLARRSAQIFGRAGRAGRDNQEVRGSGLHCLGRSGANRGRH